jgi:hypothetical protein
MKTMNLTDEEIAVLHDVVNNSLSDLHTEISYTDDRDFKDALKRRQAHLQSIQQKLAAAVEQPA